MINIGLVKFPKILHKIIINATKLGVKLRFILSKIKISEDDKNGI